MDGMRLFIIVTCLLALLCCSLQAKGWKQKEFIVTMWVPGPATIENTASMAKDNYTHINWERWQDPNAPLVDFIDPLVALDVTGRGGMKSILYSVLLRPASLDDPVKKIQLDDLIEKARQNPALEAYYIVDEPQAPTFPALARLIKYVKAKDPERLTFINLYPTYASQEQLGVDLKEASRGPIGIPDNFAGVGTNAETIRLYNEYLRQYIEIIKPELISYDHYHFLANDVDGQQYFLNLALIREAAVKHNLPFLNVVQSCKIPGWRTPNAGELRWLAFTTLAYGGRGICWFIYWGSSGDQAVIRDGVRSTNADHIAAINKDTRIIGNEMLKMKSTAVYHTGVLAIGTEAVPADSPVQMSKGDYIIGLFKQNGIQNVFMLMNRDYKSVSMAKLTLNYGKGRLLEFSPYSGKWEDVQFVEPGCKVSVTLNRGDGKLFKVVKM